MNVKDNKDLKLLHIALSISHQEDINDFYKEVLGMEEFRSFKIKESHAGRIFGIKKEVPVIQLKSGKLMLELFITKDAVKHAFDHTCVSVNDREAMVEKAIRKNYEVIRIEREDFDLVFVRDKSGNIFEVKEGVL